MNESCFAYNSVSVSHFRYMNINGSCNANAHDCLVISCSHVKVCTDHDMLMTV